MATDDRDPRCDQCAHPLGQHPDRRPYVGTGSDGARRSAAIDRSEADGLHRDDPRRRELLDSADEWDRQAEVIDMLAKNPPILLTATVEGQRVLVHLWDETGAIRRATPGGITGEVAFRDDFTARWGVPGLLTEDGQ
jgi:hypothetical protein